tara:strand:- start:39 stop:230 length:192 start_codon:yes stop_codon:yes gene_type:complete
LENYFEECLNNNILENNLENMNIFPIHYRDVIDSKFYIAYSSINTAEKMAYSQNNKMVILPRI